MSRSPLQIPANETFVGVAIAIIGTLVLLSRLNVFTINIHLPGDLVTWWPLLLISWGLMLLIAPQKARR